jgi:hypothetical protein
MKKPTPPAMRFWRRRSIALAAAGCLTACTDNTTDPAGVVILDELSALPLYELVDSTRIDGHVEALSPVSWSGAFADGRIVVLEPMVAAVRIYDPERRILLATVGRPGEGPGEFRRPVRGGFRQDTLWISDPSLGRVTLISPDLHVVRTIRVPSQLSGYESQRETVPDYPFAFPYALYSGDTLLFRGLPGTANPESRGVPASPALVRGGVDGAISALVLRTRPNADASIQVRIGNSVVTFEHPFSHPAVWAVSPAGCRIAIVEESPAGRDRVHVLLAIHDPYGAELLSTRYRIPARPITGRQRDSAMAAMTAAVTDPSVLREVERAARRQMPDVFPAVADLVLGDSGDTWIGLTPGNGRQEWLIIAPNGTPRARAVLPEGSRLRALAGENIVVQENDSLDVPSIIRYGIRRPEGAAISRSQ